VFVGSHAIAQDFSDDEWKVQYSKAENLAHEIEYTYRGLKRIKDDDKFFERWTEEFEKAFEKNKSSHVDALLKLLKKRKLVFQIDKYLFEAVGKGHKDLTSVLLKNGADCDARFGTNSRTSLMAAAAAGNEQVVRVLLKSGKCNVSMVGLNDESNITAFGLAVKAHNGFVLKEFARADVPLKYAVVGKKNPIDWILANSPVGSSDRTIFLIKSIFNEDVEKIRNFRNDIGRTLLHLAVEWQSAELLEFAFANGVWAHSRDASGLTAFELALRMNEFDLADQLIARDPTLINRRDAWGRSVLATAIELGDDKMLDWVLKHRPDPTLRSLPQSIETLETSLGKKNEKREYNLENAGVTPLELSRLLLDLKKQSDPQIVRTWKKIEKALIAYEQQIKEESEQKGTPIAFSYPKDGHAVSFATLAKAYELYKSGKKAAAIKLLGGSKLAKNAMNNGKVPWTLLDLAILDRNVSLVKQLKKAGFSTSIADSRPYNPRDFMGLGVSHELEKLIQSWGYDGPKNSGRQRLRVLKNTFYDLLNAGDPSVEWLLARKSNTDFANATVLAGIALPNGKWIERGIKAGVDFTLVEDEDLPSPYELEGIGVCFKDKSNCDPRTENVVVRAIVDDPMASDLAIRPRYEWFPPLNPEQTARACQRLWNQLTNGSFDGLANWLLSNRIKLPSCADQKLADRVVDELIVKFKKNLYGGSFQFDHLEELLRGLTMLEQLGANYDRDVGLGSDGLLEYFGDCSRNLTSKNEKTFPSDCGYREKNEKNATFNLMFKSAYRDLVRAHWRQVQHRRSTRDCAVVEQKIEKEFQKNRTGVQKFLTELFKPIFVSRKASLAEDRKRLKAMAKSKSEKECRAEALKFIGEWPQELKETMMFKVCQPNLRKIYRSHPSSAMKAFQKRVGTNFESATNYLCANAQSNWWQFENVAESIVEDLHTIITFEPSNDDGFDFFSEGSDSCSEKSESYRKTDARVEYNLHLGVNFEYEVSSHDQSEPKSVDRQFEEQLKQNLSALHLDSLARYKARWYPHCVKAGQPARLAPIESDSRAAP